MADFNPYEPPLSRVSGSRRSSSLSVAIVANCIALLIIGWGFVEVLGNESKSPLLVVMAALPAVLFFVNLRVPRIPLIRSLSLILGIFFSGLYILALVTALMKTGFAYPLALIYPALLSLALGVGAFALMRHRPNNSFKPSPHQGGA